MSLLRVTSKRVGGVCGLPLRPSLGKEFQPNNPSQSSVNHSAFLLHSEILRATQGDDNSFGRTHDSAVLTLTQLLRGGQ